MQRRRWQFPLFAVVTVLILGPPRAPAGNIGKDIVRGLGLAGFQISGTRNPFTEGIELNFGRTFPGDVLDLGLADFRLAGTLAGNVTIGLKPIATVEFGLSTAGAPLSYAFGTSTGIEDFAVAGSVVIESVNRFNQLGSYDVELFVSNRGGFTFDGFADLGGGSLDFDLGPINVSGNVFVDAIAGALGGGPPASIGEEAAKQIRDRFEVDALAARRTGGEALSGEELRSLVAGTLASAAATGDDAGTAVAGLILTDDDLARLAAALPADAPAADFGTPVPEPATLALLATPLAVVALRVRRRR